MLSCRQSAERSAKILDGATTADLSEIEQIVKERMVSPALYVYMYYNCTQREKKCAIRVSFTGTTHGESRKA